jgi:hypothetical protein
VSRAPRPRLETSGVPSQLSNPIQRTVLLSLTECWVGGQVSVTCFHTRCWPCCVSRVLFQSCLHNMPRSASCAFVGSVLAFALQCLNTSQSVNCCSAQALRRAAQVCAALRSLRLHSSKFELYCDPTSRSRWPYSAPCGLQLCVQQFLRELLITSHTGVCVALSNSLLLLHHSRSC